VHVMAYRQEEAVAEIIHRAGLFPRRARQALPSAPANASHEFDPPLDSTFLDV